MSLSSVVRRITGGAASRGHAARAPGPVAPLAPVPENWHEDFIVHLASVLRPMVYVELGLYRCELFNRIIPYAERLTGVDIDPGAGEWMAASPKVRFVNASTDAFAKSLKDDPIRIDMLFIDADHSRQAVLNDFWNLFPYVAPQGLIILHDTHPKNLDYTRPGLCGDAYKVPALLAEHPDRVELMTIPTHPGLTLCRKRTAQLVWLEPGSAPSAEGAATASPDATARVVVCNDHVRGLMGERVFWQFLCERLPGVAAVDSQRAGSAEPFEDAAARCIREHRPAAAVLIQNATFMDLVPSDLYTIVYLQDNLRAMGRRSGQQEQNLRHADLIVANSQSVARSYPEFDVRVIPIGVDDQLFKPMPREALRRRHRIPAGRVGIFVGDLSEVKGWPRVRRIIKAHPEIFWVVVSKGADKYDAPNARTWNRIPQEDLAELLNCADFFILGSPVESLCLAAVEACFCNVPVIMRNTGVFADFSPEDKAAVGLIGDDIESAVLQIGRTQFEPRAVMLRRKLTLGDMLVRWTDLLREVEGRKPKARTGYVASRRTQPGFQRVRRCAKRFLPAFMLRAARSVRRIVRRAAP